MVLCVLMTVADASGRGRDVYLIQTERSATCVFNWRLIVPTE